MEGAISRKASGISCDLTVFRKIKEHRANAVETPLGVTGLLVKREKRKRNEERRDGLKHINRGLISKK